MFSPGILDYSKCAQWNYGAFVMRSAEFWGNAMCAPLFHGDIVMDAKISIKNHQKLRLPVFFKVFFCKLLSFHSSIHSLGLVLKEKNILYHSTFSVSRPSI